MPDETQSETAYSRLHQAIRRGDLKPGERIRENELADLLTLSRTPIREALRQLEADGIVEHRPRQGAVIRTLSHAEVVELYEMRMVLERTAAEMAAKHASAAELDELDDLNAAIAATHDPVEAARINHHFHQCIHLAGRNRFLRESARALDNAMMLLGPTTLDDDTRIALVAQQHQSIITALRDGDAETAGAAAEAHIQTSLRHRLKTLRS